jgi:hypothetical protein
MRTVLAGAFLTLLAVVPAAPAPASVAACTDRDVVVVVEPASLGGEPETRCAADLPAGATAQDALVASGLELQETTGSAPFVCRVDGRPGPDLERCGASLSGDGYWAFLLADEGADWTFAQTGLREQRVRPGQFVALRYQLLADGEDVEVTTPATARTRERTPRRSDVADTSVQEEPLLPGGAELATTGVAALLVVGLVVVAAVVVRRRRA